MSEAIGRRIGLAALLLSASALVSRFLGVARESVFGALYGSGVEANAYAAAFALPDMLAYFLTGGVLSITFIPLFSGFIERGDEPGGWRLFSTIATTLGGLLTLATAAAWIAAPQIVPLYAADIGSPEGLALCIEMTRIVLFAQIAFFLGGLIQSTLFVREIFWPAAVSPLVYNVCIIAGGVWLAPYLGARGFAVGVLVGAWLGPFGVAALAARGRIRFRPRLSIRSEGMRSFFKLSLPLMLGASLVTADTWLLTYFGTAHIWLLGNARKLMMVGFALIGQAAGQAALPYLSRLYEQGRERELDEVTERTLSRVVFLSILGTAGLIAVARPISFALYFHGEMRPERVEQLAEFVPLFAVGLTSWTAQAFVGRAFYARRDTVSPMLIGVVVIALSIPIYFGLKRAFGPHGLALATSIGITLHLIGLVAVYRRRKGSLPLGGAARSAARALGGAIVAGAAGWGAARGLEAELGLGSVWRAAAAVATAGAAFLGSAATLYAIWRPPEVAFLIERIERKLKRES